MQAPEIIDAELIYLLLAAGDRVCDMYGDSQQARDDMRDDCLATPPHLRADLLDHLTSTAIAAADFSAVAHLPALNP
jgi:hypothetical protein